MPALLMTMSMRPKASSAVCTMAAPPSGVATVWVSGTATPPRSSICLAVVDAGPSSPPTPLTEPPTSLITTWAPREASRRACSRPRPPPAPVMIATLPSKPRSAMSRKLVGHRQDQRGRRRSAGLLPAPDRRAQGQKLDGVLSPDVVLLAHPRADDAVRAIALGFGLHPGHGDLPGVV